MNVSLDREDGRYEAGGQLIATWKVRRVPAEQVEGVEVSVLWFTEGKGDEDLHVHHFQRLTAEQLRLSNFDQQRMLSCRLPATPLSYHGRLINIRWCIRLRLFLNDGREIVAEQPFQLVAYDSAVRPRFWISDSPKRLRREELSSDPPPASENPSPATGSIDGRNHPTAGLKAVSSD